MALIIGSVAMRKHFPKFREPKDLDLFANPNSRDKWWEKNGKAADVFWHPAFEGTTLDRDDFATVDEIYTIKVSHAYWELDNGSWGKHMWDILFLQEHGAQLDLDLHQMLYKVWIEKHGKKKMNLAQAAGMFFKDAVVRIYDHDSIHESVAYGDSPLYERILKDGETVDIDPDKLWNGLTFEEQVMLFREEICATALERWMIPTNYKYSPGRAYQQALRKTITSLTKGKSARFIVTNFKHFKSPHDYMKIHFSKLDKLLPLDTTKEQMS